MINISSLKNVYEKNISVDNMWKQAGKWFGDPLYKSEKKRDIKICVHTYVCLKNCGREMAMSIDGLMIAH